MKYGKVSPSEHFNMLTTSNARKTEHNLSVLIILINR